MTSTTPDNQHGQVQSMTSLQTLAELIAEYEDELAECKREFAEAFRRERARTGLSLREVADLAGLERTHVHYIERERRRPNSSTARKLANAMASARERAS